MSDKIHYTDKEYEQVLIRLSELIDRVEQIEDPVMVELFEQILRHFDAAHREGIARLAQFLQKDHPAIMERIKNDYAIRHLLALYDVIAFDGVEPATEARAFISESEIKKIVE